MPTFIETQSHLGTTATCLPELVEQLGQRPPILNRLHRIGITQGI